MFPKMFLCSLWITVFLVTSYSGATQGEQPERCFLYPVNEKTESPSYDLLDNQDNYVIINHIFKKPSYTQIVDQEDTCIVAIGHDNYDLDTEDDSKDCQVKISGDEEFTTLVFRRRGETVTLNKKMENEVNVSVSPKTLKIKSKESINVAFDCPGNCYQFEKAIIHKGGSKQDSPISLTIYAMIQIKEDANGSRINIINGRDFQNNDWAHLSKWDLESTHHDQWFSIDIEASFKTHKSETWTRKVQSLTSNFPIYETGGVPTRDLYLDFGETSGIRWAVFCNPDKGTSTSTIDTTQAPGTNFNFPEGEWKSSYQMLYFIIAIAVCGVLLIILICSCVYIRHLRRLQRTANPNATATRDTTVPSVTAPKGNTEYNEDNHEYDYIDPVAYQQQMQRDQSLSKQNLTRNETYDETAGNRNSHTSINSLYGYTGNAHNNIPNNAGDSNVRRNSHTSTNSLYGYTGRIE